MENESEMAGENNKQVIRMYSDKFGCIRLAPFSTLLSIDCSLLSTVSRLRGVSLKQNLS